MMRFSAACLLFLAGIAAADVSPRRKAPLPPVEKLGNQFTHVDSIDDAGLAAGVWRNHTLDRDETWHQEPGGEWFLKLKDGAYVLAEHVDGQWRTVPKERLVLKVGAWERVRLK
jgi:hypothetical protein